MRPTKDSEALSCGFYRPAVLHKDNRRPAIARFSLHLIHKPVKPFAAVLSVVRAGLLCVKTCLGAFQDHGRLDCDLDPVGETRCSQVYGRGRFVVRVCKSEYLAASLDRSSGKLFLH